MVAAHRSWDPETSGGTSRELPQSHTVSLHSFQQDLNNTAKLPEARRSTRVKQSGGDISRDPYMLWTNRRAVNSS